MKIAIMDTTLRDGEQTSGVSFNDVEKLNIAKLLLEELKIDRIEIASARVSQGEFQAVKKISEWAKKTNFIDKIIELDRGEVLGNIKSTCRKNRIQGCCSFFQISELNI